MSPLQIQILLHYYACADDFRNGDFSAPAVRTEIDLFVSEGALTTSKNIAEYGITERGKAFVDYICSLPLPVQKWEMPP